LLLERIDELSTPLGVALLAIALGGLMVGRRVKQYKSEDM
jgi:hypothetical protein